MPMLTKLLGNFQMGMMDVLREMCEEGTVIAPSWMLSLSVHGGLRISVVDNSSLLFRNSSAWTHRDLRSDLAISRSA
jgi:hypothetical protein